MADDVVKPDAQATPDATVLTTPAADPKAPAAGEPKAGDPAAPKPEDGKKQTGAPEKYADFKLPEGFTIQDQERFTKFTDLAKSKNLSQEDAQAFIDLAIANSTEAGKAQEAALEAQEKAWMDEIQKDPELGGANAAATIEYAKRSLKTFAQGKFMEVLEDKKFGRLGNHPDFVRTFVAIGKAMSEDKVVDGRPSGTADEKSAADVLYGK